MSTLTAQTLHNFFQKHSPRLAAGHDLSLATMPEVEANSDSVFEPVVPATPDPPRRGSTTSSSGRSFARTEATAKGTCDNDEAIVQKKEQVAGDEIKGGDSEVDLENGQSDDDDDKEKLSLSEVVANCSARGSTAGHKMLAAALSTKPIEIPANRMVKKGHMEDDFMHSSGARTFCCHRCNVYFEEKDVYKTGRAASVTFKCKGCNRLEGRLRTLKTHSGGEFLLAWDRVDAATMAEFMNGASELVGAELTEAMHVAVKKSKSMCSEVFVGSTGQFYPENYYKEVLKFTDKQVENIKLSCEHHFCNKIGDEVYCYDIENRGNKDNERVGTEATFTPAASSSGKPTVMDCKGTKQETVEKRKKLQSSSSSSSSTGSDGEVGGSDGQSKAKKKLRAAKKAKKAELKEKKRQKKRELHDRKATAASKKDLQKLEKQASQNLGKLTPLITKIEAMTRNRVTIHTKKYLPQYMVDEVNNMLLVLKNMVAAWTSFVQTGQASIPADMSSEIVAKQVTVGTILANDFDTMLAVAQKQSKA